MNGHYNVLHPVFFGTGQMVTLIDNRTGRAIQKESQRVEWACRGTALSMADAKAQYGGAPVLEWVAG